MLRIPKSFVSMIMTALLLASLTAIASAEDEQYVEKTFTYTCTVKVLGINLNFPLPLTVKGYGPISVEPSDQITLTNASATAAVPSNIVSILDGLLSWDYTEGTVTKFVIESENLDDTIDVAELAIPNTKVPKDGSDLIFTVPEVGGISVGPFTAGTSGVVTLSAGELSAEFEKGSDKGLDVKLTADCEPPEDNTIVEITIN
ncbi:DUF6801 domain-containing protein [Pueribacillus sp. YX66]|uniref:DUF6801 domain-containing protein n=1 Tax=Pueribacillus sp. YX66 TaxID=3229242 RepID=UPI00358D5C9A